MVDIEEEIEQEAGNVVEEVVSEIENFIDETLPEIVEQLQGKQVIIFVGKTRSGKSTLVNYLLNKPLRAYRDECLINQFRVAAIDGGASTIGHGSRSSTRLPNIYEDEYIDSQTQTRFTLIDAPGFDDNRGIAQEIINSVCIQSVLKLPRTIKLVLTSDMGDVIKDDRRCFLDLIERMVAIAPQLASVQPGVSIIFTKDRDAYNRTGIARLLQRLIVDAFESNTNLQLVDYLARNPEKIGFFYMPRVEGPLVNDDVNGFIEEAIRESDPIPQLGQSNFALSSEARLQLSEIIDQRVNSSDFTNALAHLLDRYVIYLENLTAPGDPELIIATENIKNILGGLRQKQESVDSVLGVVQAMDELNNMLDVTYLENFSRFLKLLKCQKHFRLFTEAQENVILSKFREALNSVMLQARCCYNRINKELIERRVKRFLYGITIGAAMTIGVGIGAVIACPWLAITGAAGTTTTTGVVATGVAAEGATVAATQMGFFQVVTGIARFALRLGGWFR